MLWKRRHFEMKGCHICHDRLVWPFPRRPFYYWCWPLPRIHSFILWIDTLSIDSLQFPGMGKRYFREPIYEWGTVCWTKLLPHTIYCNLTILYRFTQHSRILSKPVHEQRQEKISIFETRIAITVGNINMHKMECGMWRFLFIVETSLVGERSQLTPSFPTVFFIIFWQRPYPSG